MKIITDFRLSTGQYFQDIFLKRNIYLHHTVGGSALSTFNYWQETADRVGTAYIVDRNGDIYEVFDPAYWCYHLGLKLAKNTFYNSRSIGIELASEGGLRSGKELNKILGQNKFDENILYAFDVYAPPFTRAKALYHIDSDQNMYTHIPQGFRDFYYFDNYDELQVQATIELVKDLCNRFQIPKAILPEDRRFKFDIFALDFGGILTHCNVRSDKSDLCPAWDWNRIEKELK